MLSEREEAEIVRRANETMPKVTVMGRSGWWATACVGYVQFNEWTPLIVYGGDGDC
jgi:hypothetical protein